jgi:AcrR family transcriptional regulator
MRETPPVPRTRRDIDRDEKVGEIVDAAVAALRTGGYGSLSVAAIARDLGLSPNSIYWYFPTKDDLFVAAVRRIVAEILAGKPPRRRRLDSRILWFIEQLDDVEHLRSALYERAHESPVVSGYVAEIEAGQQRMLVNVLRGRVPDAELAVAAATLLATIQGVGVQKLRGSDRRRVIEYAVRAVTTPEPSG